MFGVTFGTKNIFYNVMYPNRKYKRNFYNQIADVPASKAEWDIKAFSCGFNPPLKV